jgi:hypothetical protein
MHAMKKGPIGVWFSVALGILVLGYWIGWELGAGIAVYSCRFRQQKKRAQVESVLWELDALQKLQLYAVFASTFKKARKQNPTDEIAGLESLRRRSGAQEMRPVIDLEIALAHVDATIAEDQDNNKEAATNHMQYAQTLFQSLGWQDCSEETLRAVAKRELDRRNPETRSAVAQRELDQWKAQYQTRQHAK